MRPLSYSMFYATMPSTYRIFERIRVVCMYSQLAVFHCMQEVEVAAPPTSITTPEAKETASSAVPTMDGQILSWYVRYVLKNMYCMFCHLVQLHTWPHQPGTRKALFTTPSPKGCLATCWEMVTGYIHGSRQEYTFVCNAMVLIS